MPHKNLLYKIEFHRISGNVAAWIGEWFCDRKQKVVLNGKTLRLQDILLCVSQGSILGLILFIFVNDIDTVISFFFFTEMERILYGMYIVQRE